MDRSYIEKEILRALDEGSDIVDKWIDSNCNGVTRRSLEFWEVLKGLIDVNDIDAARMIYDEKEWYRLVLGDIHGRRYMFYGLSSGYNGEGPNGCAKVLRECGFDEGDIRLVYEAHNFTIFKD